MHRYLFLIFSVLFFLFSHLGWAEDESSVYHHKKLGVSFHMPQGWHVQTLAQSSRVIVLSKFKKVRASHPQIVLTALYKKLKMPGSQEQLRAVVSQFVGPLLFLPHISKLKVVDMGLSKKKRGRSFNYKTTYFLKTNREAKGVQMTSLNEICEINGRYYDLNLLAPKSAFKKYEKLFYGVKDSMVELAKGKKVKKKKGRKGRKGRKGKKKRS